MFYHDNGVKKVARDGATMAMGYALNGRMKNLKNDGGVCCELGRYEGGGEGDG